MFLESNETDDTETMAFWVQNAPCSETMAFWEYCFSECPLFGNHGILGRMPPCLETMAFWEYCFPECHLFKQGAF